MIISNHESSVAADLCREQEDAKYFDCLRAVRLLSRMSAHGAHLDILETMKDQAHDKPISRQTRPLREKRLFRATRSRATSVRTK